MKSNTVIMPQTKCDTDNTKHRTTLFCVIFFGIAILLLIGLGIWRVQVWNETLWDVMQEKGAAVKIVNRSNPLEVFPGAFMTVEQHDILMRKYDRRSREKKTTPMSGCNLACETGLHSFPTYPTTSKSDITNLARQSVLEETSSRYHACCKSERRQIRPIKGTNVNDITRYIVQQKPHWQFILTEECSQGGCSWCVCDQPDPYRYRLVVYTGGLDDNRFDATLMEYDTIEFPGCCKCMNYENIRDI